MRNVFEETSVLTCDGCQQGFFSDHLKSIDHPTDDGAIQVISPCCDASWYEEEEAC